MIHPRQHRNAATPSSKSERLISNKKGGMFLQRTLLKSLLPPLDAPLDPHTTRAPGPAKVVILVIDTLQLEVDGVSARLARRDTGAELGMLSRRGQPGAGGRGRAAGEARGRGGDGGGVAQEGELVVHVRVGRRAGHRVVDGEALGHEGAQREDEDDRGDGQGGRFELAKVAVVEASKQDFRGDELAWSVVNSKYQGGGKPTRKNHQQAVGHDKDLHRAQPLYRRQDASVLPHVHDEADVEQEAEPGDHGRSKSQVRLPNPQIRTRIQRLQGALDRDGSRGALESYGDGGQDQREGDAANLPGARPQLNHGPGLNH